jgi:hypothetical protein
MAYHTFRHPDFAGPYRGIRIVTRDNPTSPKTDFIPAGTFENDAALRIEFPLSDTDWAYAQTRLSDPGYFVCHFLAGVMPGLPA